MNRRLLLLASLALLSGCATTSPSAEPAPAAVLEPLYSANAGREALTIKVASNGCTKKEDFVFRLERKGETPTLAFTRERPDRCRAFVMAGVELTFSYAELGLDARTPLRLLNPFAAWTGPAPSAP